MSDLNRRFEIFDQTAILPHQPIPISDQMKWPPCK